MQESFEIKYKTTDKKITFKEFSDSIIAIQELATSYDKEASPVLYVEKVKEGSHEIFAFATFLQQYLIPWIPRFTDYIKTLTKLNNNDAEIIYEKGTFIKMKGDRRLLEKFGGSIINSGGAESISITQNEKEMIKLDRGNIAVIQKTTEKEIEQCEANLIEKELGEIEGEIIQYNKNTKKGFIRIDKQYNFEIHDNTDGLFVPSVIKAFAVGLYYKDGLEERLKELKLTMVKQS